MKANGTVEPITRGGLAPNTHIAKVNDKATLVLNTSSFTCILRQSLHSFWRGNTIIISCEVAYLWLSSPKENSVGRKVAFMDMSLQGILEVALQQGIWAALYIYLFFRMLKQNEEREFQYQATIKSLSGDIAKGIEIINERLDDIENALPVVKKNDTAK